jgi:hypothetical protein
VEPGTVPALCREYGIEWVVFENAPDRPYWAGLPALLRAEARLERSIPLESTRWRWRSGTVDIYRFDLPADPPRGGLRLNVPKLHEQIRVKL